LHKSYILKNDTGDNMAKAQYNLKHKDVLDSFLLDIPIVKPGKMYGHPAYYVGGKLFASLFMEGVCVKVPEKLVKELLKKDGIEHFEPMGRKMREWILINRDKSEDYVKDQDIFEKSIEYVASLSNIEFKRK
jgi:hypothetical protein